MMTQLSRFKITCNPAVYSFSQLGYTRITSFAGVVVIFIVVLNLTPKLTNRWWPPPMGSWTGATLSGLGRWSLSLSDSLSLVPSLSLSSVSV
jgi:hypothetical protein